MSVLTTTQELKAFIMRRRRDLRIAGEWTENPSDNARRLESDLMEFLQKYDLVKTRWVKPVKDEIKDFIGEITRDVVCPACGEKYYGDPAMSRRDGRDICPMCGLREALEDAGFPTEQVHKTITELNG